MQGMVGSLGCAPVVDSAFRFDSSFLPLSSQFRILTQNRLQHRSLLSRIPVVAFLPPSTTMLSALKKSARKKNPGRINSNQRLGRGLEFTNDTLYLSPCAIHQKIGANVCYNCTQITLIVPEFDYKRCSTCRDEFPLQFDAYDRILCYKCCPSSDTQTALYYAQKRAAKAREPKVTHLRTRPYRYKPIVEPTQFGFKGIYKTLAEAYGIDEQARISQTYYLLLNKHAGNLEIIRFAVRKKRGERLEKMREKYKRQKEKALKKAKMVEDAIALIPGMPELMSRENHFRNPKMTEPMKIRAVWERLRTTKGSTSFCLMVERARRIDPTAFDEPVNDVSLGLVERALAVDPKASDKPADDVSLGLVERAPALAPQASDDVSLGSSVWSIATHVIQTASDTYSSPVRSMTKQTVKLAEDEAGGKSTCKNDSIGVATADLFIVDDVGEKQSTASESAADESGNDSGSTTTKVLTVGDSTTDDEVGEEPPPASDASRSTSSSHKKNKNSKCIIPAEIEIATTAIEELAVIATVEIAITASQVQDSKGDSGTIGTDNWPTTDNEECGSCSEDADDEEEDDDAINMEIIGTDDKEADKTATTTNKEEESRAEEHVNATDDLATTTIEEEEESCNNNRDRNVGTTMDQPTKCESGSSDDDDDNMLLVDLPLKRRNQVSIGPGDVPAIIAKSETPHSTQQKKKRKVPDPTPRRRSPRFS